MFARLELVRFLLFFKRFRFRGHIVTVTNLSGQVVPANCFGFGVVLLQSFHFRFNFPRLNFHVRGVLIQPSIFFCYLAVYGELEYDRYFFGENVGLYFPFRVFFLFQRFHHFALVPFRAIL